MHGYARARTSIYMYIYFIDIWIFRGPTRVGQLEVFGDTPEPAPLDDLSNTDAALSQRTQ